MLCDSAQGWRNAQLHTCDAFDVPFSRFRLQADDAPRCIICSTVDGLHILAAVCRRIQQPRVASHSTAFRLCRWAAGQLSIAARGGRGGANPPLARTPRLASIQEQGQQKKAQRFGRRIFRIFRWPAFLNGVETILHFRHHSWNIYCRYYNILHDM